MLCHNFLIGKGHTCTNVFRIRSESPLVTMYAIQLVGSTTMVPGIAILEYEYHTIGTFWYGTRVRTYVLATTVATMAYIAS